MADPSFVRAQNLEHDFANRPALQGVSLDMRRGEVLGLLGANGAGKSTTLRILSATLTPRRGRVSIDNIDSVADPTRYKSCLGYLPDIAPLYPELSVDEYLLFCARLRGVNSRQVRSKVAQAKRQCGLDDCGARLIAHLSKGFQQRVGIAQAIVHEPALVILDEPTTGLDPLQIRDIRTLLRELAGERSVLFSSHQLSEVQAVCDRVQIIDKGRSLLDEPMAQLQQPVPGIIVRFNRAPDITELEQLAGAESVTMHANGNFRITTHDVHTLTAAVVETSVARTWGLMALSSEQTSLEDVFVALVAGRREDTREIS